MEKISILKERWLKKEIANLKEKGISKADIANRLDIKPQYLNNIINGGRGITDTFLDKFLEEFKINHIDLFCELTDSSLESIVIYNRDPKDVSIIANNQTIIERDAEILIANKETIEIQKELISALKQRIKELERGSSSKIAGAFTSVRSAALTGRTSRNKTTK